MEPIEQFEDRLRTELRRSADAVTPVAGLGGRVVAARQRQVRRRRLARAGAGAGVAAALVVGLLVVPKGSGPVGGGTGVAAAAESTSESSFRFETSLVDGGTDVRAEGAVAAGAESAVVRATTPMPDLVDEGGSGDLEVRLDGDTVYASIGAVLGPELRPDGAEWLALDLRGGGYADRMVQSLLDQVRDLDPTQALELLEDATSDVVEDGSEEVRGEPTTRYRFRAAVNEDVDVPGRAWVDGEGRLRRLELSERGTTATVDLFDFGAEVDVEPPPAAETITVDRLLRDALGR